MSERDLGSFYGVIARKSEAETVGLVLVERVRIKDSYVHLPFLEIVC